MESQKINKEMKKFIKEFSEESYFRKSVSSEPKFLRRRLDLIVRDPLAIEAVKEADKLPLPIGTNDWTPKIQGLVAKLEKKWNVTVLFTRDQKCRYKLSGWKYDDSIDPDGIRPLVIKMKDINDSEGWVRRAVEPIWFHRLNASKKREAALQPLINYLDGNRFASEDRLFIGLDLNLIDSNDARFIKKTVWSIIKRYLAKRKEEGKKKRILDEPKELLFIYDCREQTFQNYLRWYDLNIGTDYQKPNGSSFREIAFCEYMQRNHRELYGDIKERIVHRTKVIRSTKGERVLKGVIGEANKEAVKREDAVGKGVKAIYGAIHRKAYPSKKTKQKEYNCPVHGSLCREDCSYLKQFMKDFNRRMMLFKPLNTTDPAVLPQVIGEGRSHSKRKPTADQQSNTK
jgi:hypothetical protein